MTNENVVSEFLVVDGASEALEKIERKMRAVQTAAGDFVTVQEKQSRRTEDAVKKFERLEKAQDKLAGAAQRLKTQLSTIDFARNTGGLGRSEEGTRRLDRAMQLANERFEEVERRIKGNVTAYEQLRNSLDPVAQAQRRFAEGQEIIAKALASGEANLKDNGAELERMKARLDDQRRAAEFASDDYAQLTQRLNPLAAAEREFAIAISTVNDALQRGRIDGQQAKADLAALRGELEKARDAVSGQRSAYQQLVDSIDPVARAEREHAEALKIVNAALAAGESSDTDAARVKKILADRLNEVSLAARENATAFQSLRAEIDPVVRAEQDLERKLRIVDDALASGEATEKQAADAKAKLRRQVEDLKNSINSQASAYDKIIDRIDPVSAAERRLSADLEDLKRALDASEIGIVEHDKAAGTLKAQFDALKRQVADTKTEFQELTLKIDPAARAMEEFNRDSRIVSAALERQEISAEKAAAAIRLLEERYKRAEAAGNRFEDGAGNLGRGIGRLNLAFTAGAGLVTAFVGSFAVRKLAEFNDTLQQSENRLRIVTDSAGELAATQEALFESSQRSFTEILAGVEIYERLARSTKNLEVSNNRLLTVTEAIQKSVALSGTTALAANAALIQFGQGLAADSLRGQELNSVMEQTPRLARALAEGLGVSIGKLREMANQGELTAEKVINAIESQVDTINREFATIEPTLQQVATQVENTVTIIGAAFSQPIINELKEQLEELQKTLEDPANKDRARAFGNDIAIGLDFAGEAAGRLLNFLGRIVTANAEARQQTADKIIQTLDDPQASPRDKFAAENILIFDAGVRKLVEIRREQLAVEKEIAGNREKFETQESIEALGQAFGLSAAAARAAGIELGFLEDSADALDAEQAEAFAKAIADVGQGVNLEPLAEDLDEVTAQFIALASLGSDAIARLNAAAADTRGFDAFIADLDARLEKLREKKNEERFDTKSGIIEAFNEAVPGATPEQTAEVAKLGAEIERLSAKTKEAADRFLELALRQRELTDLQSLAAAAAFGPDAESDERARQELAKELIRLEAEAREDKRAFNREEERARLQAILDLEKQIELQRKIFEERKRLQERVIEDVRGGIDDTVGVAGRDRRASSAVEAQRQQALFEALTLLARRRKQFDEVESAGLDEEQIAEMERVFDESARELRRIFVEDGPREFEERLRSATENLAKTLLEDVFFNGGKGLGDILEGFSAETFSKAIIDPLSKFLAGESNDPLGDINAALEESSKRFERIGGQLGKLFDNEEFGKIIGKNVGEAFNNFAIGNTIQGLFGDSKAGKIGAGAGAVVGQIAELATGIPFLGEAIGALGGLIGGLFGRKTATGTFDFTTGNIDLEASKKDARNQERDVVLEQAINAVQALAEALGGRLRVGTGLEVNVSKRSITTDIVDPRTGQVIQAGGSVGRGDIAGAVSDVLNAALSAVIEGGDERLTKIAKAFASVDLPAEKLVNSVSNLATVFDYIEGPASQFSEVLDEVVSIFGEATSAAGQYAAATRELAQAQLDTLNALAGKFDEDVEKSLRSITDPLLQQALDLSENQLKRLEDAKKLNDELLKAVRAVSGAPAAPGTPGAPLTGFGLNPGFDVFGDRFAGLQRFFQQNATIQTPAQTAAQSAAAAEAAAEAQERLNRVIELNTEEFKNFIREAGGTPEAFAAVAAAIEDLRANATELGIDFADLNDALEEVRAGLAAEFDQSEEDRLTKLENPLKAQVEGIIDAQIKIIDAARSLGGSQEELAARLARVFATNAVEFEKFIEGAASTPEAIAEVVAALEALRDNAEEVGLSIERVNQLSADAIIGAGDAFLETINKDFLRFTNDPLSRLVSLLEAQEKFVDTAKKFAELNPARFGGLPAIIQNRNALEREKFLESLSDEEKLRLGDFVGLIEDYGGRIAVVSTQLRDTLKKNTDDVEKEIERLNDVFETSTDRANQFADARQALTDRFFPGTPLEQFRDTRSRLEAEFEKAAGGDERALDNISSLVAQFVDQAANVFGADEDFVAAQQRAFEILNALEETERGKADQAQSEREILEADLETSKNILKSLESAQDNTLYLQQIVDNGVLQNQLLEDQIEELLRLRALQSSQDVNAVNQLAAIDSAQSILSGFIPRNSAYASIDPDAISTLVQSAVAGSTPPFSFAQSSFDVASQIAEIMALARQSQSELTVGNNVVQAGAVNQAPQTSGAASAQIEVVLAIGALEQTLAGGLKALIDAMTTLKDEIRILRNDNVRLNNELKAAYRLATTQSASVQ